MMEQLTAFVNDPNTRTGFTIWATMFGAFHVASAVFAWLDSTGARGEWPGRLVWKYKIVKSDPVDYWMCMPVCLRNQLLIMLPVMTVGPYYGLAFQADTRVPLWMFPVHAYLLGVVHDVVFYVGHKLLHTRFGYTYLGHNVHHRSRGGTAASSMYMAPFDFVVEIILPYAAFVCLFATDVRFDVGLASIGSLAAMYEHSGYCFSHVKAIDSRMHISHHAGRWQGSLSEGVGSPGYCDLLFGTQLKEEDFARYNVQQERTTDHADSHHGDDAHPKKEIFG